MRTNIAISHKMLLSHMLSEFINFSIFLLFFAVEATFITQKREAIYHLMSALFCLALPFATKHFTSKSSSAVYLVDFSCLKPPNFCRVPTSTYIEHTQMLDFLDQSSVDFMKKVVSHSGQGESTYLPPAIHYIPPKSGHGEAMAEVDIVLSPVLEDLLKKTKTSPSEIDILIVNCSGFCPSPSLSAMMVNKFRMREDVKSFTVSGMGCSASALAVDMARNVLKTQRNSNALVLSTEILSTGWYPGKEQSMMVLNCVFRMGAAAILLTNKTHHAPKYKLLHSVRTHRAFDDKGYYSAIREEDFHGLTGVTLTRDLLLVSTIDFFYDFCLTVMS